MVEGLSSVDLSLMASGIWQIEDEGERSCKACITLTGSFSLARSRSTVSQANHVLVSRQTG